jgi:diacylglycerol O-acyltransferase
MTESVRRLSTGDLMTLWAQTPTTPMNIAVLGLLPAAPLLDADGALRLPALRAAIADRLDRTPQLRRRIRRTRFGEGRPVWADDETFDVARHVHAVHLPAVGQPRLLSWAAAHAAVALPTGQPLWQLTFVTGLDTGEVGALLVVHHAIADGVTGVALLSALLDGAPGERPPPTTWAPAPPPTAGELVRDAAASRGRALATSLPGRRAGRRQSRGRGRGRGLGRDLHAVRTALAEPAPDLGLPMAGHGGRQAVALRWPLQAVRGAAHHHDATINDLMLAAVAAGLRDVLIARGVPVDGLAVQVSVPVSAPAGTQAGGTMPLVLSLPLGDPDPASVLRSVSAASRAAKAARDRGYAGPAASPLFPLFLVRLGTAWLRRHGGERINLYVTNVPGPAHPLWLCGARVRALYPIAPIAAGVPLAVAVLSYHDSISLTVNASPHLELGPFEAGARRAIAAAITASEPVLRR